MIAGLGALQVGEFTFHRRGRSLFRNVLDAATVAAILLILLAERLRLMPPCATWHNRRGSGRDAVGQRRLSGYAQGVPGPSTWLASGEPAGAFGEKTTTAGPSNGAAVQVPA
jgi:hypothetical protein